MIKAITLAAMVGLFLSFLGCGAVNTGGGRVESCGIDMRYCSPGP